MNSPHDSAANRTIAASEGTAPAVAPEIPCPLCRRFSHSLWGEENGYKAVKCGNCGLVYVTPRPSLLEITEAVKLGKHRTEKGDLDVSARRTASKVRHYQSIISDMYADDIAKARPLLWLDVGSGYGEFVEALLKTLPQGSRASGIEPMVQKVKIAQSLGLPVENKALSEIDEKYDVVSLVNVFSHIPDFSEFIQQIANLLKPSGEVFIETGNAGDLSDRSKFPEPLYLPDHLVFAGEKHIANYLERAGFVLVGKRRLHVATVAYAIKNLIKRMIGRPARIVLPYASPYRTVFYRARLVESR